MNTTHPEPTQRDFTYGEKAVGLSYNPSSLSQVDECKRRAADFIDTMDATRASAVDPEVKRMASIAITEMQAAQMWAVKALTWR